MIIKKLVLLILFGAASAFCTAQKKYDLVKDFGAKADNKTDCYDALKKAAATISAAGGGILNIPKGKYFIARYKIISGKEGNDVTDIQFIGCKGLVIDGNGAEIRINGNFMRSNDYGLDGIIYRYSYKHTVCPFMISNSTNVTIRNINIDGGVRNMRKDIVVEGDCYGIKIDDLANNAYQSNNISIIGANVNYCATDGIYIRANGKNISIINCRADHNARQGLSVVAGKKIIIDRCTFDSTGYSGKYGWHAPGAGIDIENELGPGKLQDVIIKNSRMSHNTGFQVVTTLSSENVTIDSCFIADSTNGRSDGLNGVGMYSLNSKLSNSIIFATIQIDLAGEIYTGTAIQTFSRNIIYSSGRAMLSSDFLRPCNISENMLIMLPKPDPAEYFPYIINSNAVFSNNVIMYHMDKVLASPNSITGLLQGLKYSEKNAFLVSDYFKDKKSRSTYYRVALSKISGAQYFPENDMIRSLGTDKQLFFLSDEVIKKVSSYEVFRAYQQNSFNVKFLQQANEIRKYLALKMKQ